MGEKKKTEAGATFKIGAICLAFLIIGYQTSLFIQRAAILKIEANRDRPDTVYIVEDKTSPAAKELSSKPGQHQRAYRSNAPHSEKVEAVRKATRRTESFRFNPNTVSVDELMRLGFSEKQARAIDNYRSKGGRFRRRSDFAKSFVVADSVYRRLEKYIDIPKTDINNVTFLWFGKLLPMLGADMDQNIARGLMTHFIKPVCKDADCAAVIIEYKAFYLDVMKKDEAFADPIAKEMISVQAYAEIGNELKAMVKEEKKN